MSLVQAQDALYFSLSQTYGMTSIQRMTEVPGTDGGFDPATGNNRPVQVVTSTYTGVLTQQGYYGDERSTFAEHEYMIRLGGTNPSDPILLRDKLLVGGETFTVADVNLFAGKNLLWVKANNKT